MDRKSRKPNHETRGAASPGLVDELRAKVTPEQRVLLARLWKPSEPFGWTPAKLLFHQLPTAASRSALEVLGGSAVAETQGTQDESYVLRLLGAFLGDRGPEREQLLARYLAYLVQRYDADPSISEISSEDVARDLMLSEPELSDLPYLVNMAMPSFCSGSSRNQDGWTLGTPRDIHDLAEVRDWPRYIRERALRDYDPKLPVRASARAEYLNRRQLVAQRRRRREAEESLPTPAMRSNRRHSGGPGLNWLMPFAPTEAPDWPCPTCKLGSLLPVDKSLASYETKRSREARDNEDWTPEWREELATLALRCARSNCGEYVLVSGYLGNKQVEGFETFVPEFRPLHVQPSPELFDLPPACPVKIADELRRAFSLFWLDAPAAANSVRSAVERLLDHLRVPKTAPGSNKRRLSLHSRIERYRKGNPELGEALMAVKWIGNEGSHRGELDRPDLIVAFEMLSYVLDTTFDDRATRVAKMAGRINRARRGKPAK
jgi:hypothetical protein